MGGGGLPHPISPRCTGHAVARNTPTWPYTSLPDHYTPKLGRALVLPLTGMLSKTSWYCCPYLPRLPSIPPPLSPCLSGFGGVQPVTPSLNPSRTMEIVPVPVASPGRYYSLPSSGVCRTFLPGPQLPGMIGRPYPQFTDVWPQSHPAEDTRQHVKRSLDPNWVGGGYHPVVCIKNAACTFNHVCPFSARLFLSYLTRIFHPSVRCPASSSSMLPPPLSPLLPATPSGGPLCPPPH